MSPEKRALVDAVERAAEDLYDIAVENDGHIPGETPIVADVEAALRGLNILIGEYKARSKPREKKERAGMIRAGLETRWSQLANDILEVVRSVPKGFAPTPEDVARVRRLAEREAAVLDFTPGRRSVNSARSKGRKEKAAMRGVKIGQ